MSLRGSILTHHSSPITRHSRMPEGATGPKGHIRENPRAPTVTCRHAWAGRRMRLGSVLEERARNMERSVVVGGLLVSVSLVLSVTLSSYASREALAVGSGPAAPPSAEVSPDSQQHVPAPVLAEVELKDVEQGSTKLSAPEGANDVREIPPN